MSNRDYWSELEPLLAQVEKPSRYIGGEYGSIHKDKVEVRICLSYPDLYELGASNLGLAILYGRLNELDYVAAERVYAPERDLEVLLREKEIPLLTLESRAPVNTMDLLGFTLQYELVYTNVLKVLDLSGIPLLAADRGEDDPIVIAGGPSAMNPEPVAEFFDLVFIGEAEDGVVSVADLLRKWKSDGKPGGRAAFLVEAAQIPGVYVPSLYVPKYGEDGAYRGVEALEGAPDTVLRQAVASLEGRKSQIPWIVPFVEAVHDRAVVELFRGCARGCRFCQAGIIYRPVRERPKKEVLEMVGESLAATGYGELSLASLCTSDYTEIREVLEGVRATAGNDLTLSLPSMRVDTFGIELAVLASPGKKGGLTLAPEAGSQRMRDIINKNVTEEDVLSAVQAAFESGWDRIKLYFMIGLPGETEEDVEAIVDLAQKILAVGKSIKGGNSGRLKIVVNVSTLVPKSHTPFQWAKQLAPEEVLEKQAMLKSRLRSRQIDFKWHEMAVSVLEGVMARADRRMSKAILAAYRKGCEFDAWSNRLNWDLWSESLSECGVDIDRMLGERDIGQPLPWDHISSGVTKEFLVSEWQRSKSGESTPDCRFDECSLCGVCQDLPLETRLASD